jgi:hypothetical protein
MDVSGIAQLATGMAQARNEQAIGIAVLRRAMDIQTASAAALLQALPPNLPPHLGQNINTTA